MKAIAAMNLAMASAVVAGIIFVSFPAKAVSSDEGKALYESKCGGCHGPNGKGTAAGLKMGVHDLASEEIQKMTDAELSSAITGGKHKNPPLKDPLPLEFKDLLSYVREFGKKK